MSGLSLTEVLYQSQNPNFDIKITPMAKSGIQNFLDLVQEIYKSLPKNTPSLVIEQLIKKIKYRDYLIKEEGSETAADEKYENIGQLINMA